MGQEIDKYYGIFDRDLRFIRARTIDGELVQGVSVINFRTPDHFLPGGYYRNPWVVDITECIIMGAV